MAEDARKMKLIKKVQVDIDKHIKKMKKDFHAMADACNFPLDNRMILRYLEGITERI
jgi:ribosomal protein S15P/S13E